MNIVFHCILSSETKQIPRQKVDWTETLEKAELKSTFIGSDDTVS